MQERWHKPEIEGPSVVPVLLGGGIPLLPSPAKRIKLQLTGHKIYKTDNVPLEYAVQ